MEKLKDNISLYEWIKEVIKPDESRNDKPAFQAFQAFQDSLSNCNNSNNLGTEAGTVGIPVAFQNQASTMPKQDPCPIAVPDAELISRDLKYLNGIGEDLTGWSLWKRIERGKEHRFAIDSAGVIRWERWYLRKESI